MDFFTFKCDNCPTKESTKMYNEYKQSYIAMVVVGLDDLFLKIFFTVNGKSGVF